PPTARRCQAHIAPPSTAKPAEVSARLSRLELTSGATTPASTALSIRPKNVPSEAAAPRSCGNRSSTSSWIGANTRATVNAISIGPHTAISSDQCSPPVNGGARETSSRFSSVAATAPTKPKVISRERGISSATRPTTQAPQSMPAISGTNSTQKYCSPSPSRFTTNSEAPATKTNWEANAKSEAEAIRSINGERPTCSSEPSRAHTRSGVRASGGRVSGSRSDASSTTSAYSPTPANTHRQSPSSSSHPATTG